MAKAKSRQRSSHNLFTSRQSRAALRLRRLLLAGFAMSALVAISLAAAASVYGEPPETLTATITATKTYDATTDGTGANVLTCDLAPDPSPNDVSCDTSGVVLTFGSADAGEDISVTLTGLALQGEDAGGYAIDPENDGGTASGTISQAMASCVVTDYSDTYDAASHGIGVACSGVDADGEAEGGTVTNTDTFKDVPGGTADWSFEGGTNYTDQSGTGSVTISKANADCSGLDGFSGTYDAGLHGAVGDCSGVDAGGAAAGSSLDRGETVRNVPGGTATWTFAGGTNYNDETNDVSVTITERDLNLGAVTDSRPYNGTTASSGTPTVDGLQGKDTVSPLVQTYASKNVLGTNGSTLNVTTYTVNDGNDGGNYNVILASALGTVTEAPLQITATANAKTANGTTSAAAIPTVTGGTVFAGDSIVGQLQEAYVSAAAAFPTTVRPSGVVNDGNGGNNYSYEYINNEVSRIRPAGVASLAFTTQPIDTKIGTPIYNFCNPGSPCATGSPDVKVTARDAYGNLAGPGAPGADGSNAAINVVVRRDTASGATIGPNGGTPTNAGVASFGGTLVLTGTYIGKLNLYVAPAGGPGSANATSSPFRIVNELKTCRTNLCKNSLGAGSGNTLQYLYGQVKKGTGNYSGTTLTTQFLAANAIDNKCGNNNTVNVPVELRADGTDVNTTSTGYMVLIIPKNTLKADGALNRSAGNFNVCLGALYLGNGTPGSYGGTTTPWKAKVGSGIGNSIARQDVLAVDGDEYWRYWGTPANCGTAQLSSTDPCVVLRTKQRSDLQALVTQGILDAGAADNMRDADLAIVIKKPGPWDGKGGAY